MPRGQIGTALGILAALCGIYVVSHFYRVSNAVIAPNLMRELSLSPQQMGFLTGAFFITFALAQLPIGMMLDRLGTRVTNPGMLVFAVAGSLLFAAADGMLGLTVGRILMGIGCSGIYIGALVVCTRWFPPDRFATMGGILLFAGSLGNLLATSPLAAATETVGWRGAFVAMAALTALVAVVGYVVIRDAPAGHAFHQRTADSLGEIFGGVGEVLANPRLPAIAALRFTGYASMLTILGLWAGPYLHDVYGLEAVARGNALLVMVIALAFGSLAFGPLDRLFDTRKGVAIAGALATVAAFAVLAILAKPPLWLATALLAAIMALSGFNIIVLAHGRTIFPDRLVGRGLTMLALVTMMGVAVMQMLTGLIAGAFAQSDGVVSPEGYRVVFAFLALSVALPLIIYSRTEDARPSLDPATR